MWMGAVLFFVGLLLHYGGRAFSWGWLPGDIIIQRGNFTFDFPAVTCIQPRLFLTFGAFAL